MILVPITFAIPYAPFASVFGFVPLPATLVGALATITVLYVLAAELLKQQFYARPVMSAVKRR
jgi:Mg2+-importing ATPase